MRACDASVRIQPEIVASMMKKMTALTATIWATNHSNDPKCRPFGYSHYGGFYGPWKELGEWSAVKAKLAAPPQH